MSFTAAQQVFGSIQESALTDMIRAFLTASHGYLRYASAAFVSATTVNAKHPHNRQPYKLLPSAQSCRGIGLIMNGV